MGNDTEYKKETKYKLEDQEYVLDVLKEYHEQTIEDCRIIGNQKYSVLISLSIALGSFIYALTQFCASTKTNVHYTLDGALKTLYSSAPSILSLSGNISSIHSESSNIANISQSQRIIIAMILTSLVLFICLVYFAVSGFVFLTMHLPLMDAFSVKIEQLQRDIIFKKMGDIDLFSWNEIKKNKSNTFKDYLKQKFIPENIDSVNTDLNVHQIQIDITKRNILNDIETF